MRKFLSLFGIHFRALMNGMNMFGAKKKKRAMTGVGVLVLIAALMLYLSGVYSFMLAEVLAPMGGLPLMLMLMMVVAASMMIIFSVNSSQGVLFGGRDNDLMFSLPVRPFLVLLSKVSAVYIENLVVSIFAVGPAAVIYVVYGGAAGVLYWVFLAVGLLLFPLIPTLLSILLGFLVSIISSRFRHRSLVTGILSIAALLAFLYFSMQINTGLTYLMQNIGRIQRTLDVWLFPIAKFQRALVHADAGAMGLYALVSLVPFLGIVYVLSLGYQPLVTRLSGHAMVKNYKLREVSGGSQMRALYNKEAQRFARSTIYMMNTGIGAVMMIGLCVYAAVKKQEIASYLYMIPFIDIGLAPALVACMCLLTSMACTTAVSISLEGKQLWIIKEAPVSTMRLFLVKILFNLTLTWPTVIISAGLLGYAFNLQAMAIAQLILLPMIYSLCAAMLGLFFNLSFPKLDAINDTVVVKQSLSAMLGMFVPMLLVIGLGLLYALVLMPVMSFGMFYGLCVLVLLAVAALLHALLRTKGVKMFELLI